ncbi:MAG TPA: adenylosuccinate synthase [Bacteroidales bacterium]|mgnify:CR=1 FL=1|nr:adenylosuccinate synthase [Bacteroidales bacterium]
MKTVDVLLGLQWGDEGKGKIVDVLAPQYDIVARFQGGPNAGHTIEFNNKKYILHSIPSGIFHDSTINIIGNGVVFDPLIFVNEINELKQASINPIENLLISKRAHFILPVHRLLDSVMEQAKGEKKIGSTLKGIGPAYTDKYARKGLRIGDINNTQFLNIYKKIKDEHLKYMHSIGFDENNFLIDGISFKKYENKWLESIEILRLFKIIDTEVYINEQIKEGKTVLAEGAQGTLLDIDFGSYPFVTSSHTVAGGVCIGLGISPLKIRKIFGVFKAYCTRVGKGPFPTEQDNEWGELIRQKGNEFGSTTGRPRRCGWLDLPALRYTTMINAVDALFMMKADVLNNIDTIPVCSKYLLNNNYTNILPYDLDDNNLKPIYDNLPGWENLDNFNLPASFMNYVKNIELNLKTPITMVSIGPDRTQTISLSDFMK